MSNAPTKVRILDAAERLFAARGYERTSLRNVTQAAGVNLAAVNYHFGSKLGLFRAVFERRVEGMNRERLDRLDALQARDPDHSPEVEEILEAFLAPALALANREGSAHFMQIVGRVHSAAGEHVEAIKDVFSEIQRRFFGALGEAVPHLSSEDLLWRGSLLAGAMCTHMANPDRIRILSGGRFEGRDPEQAVRQLVAFAAAGFRAPSAAAAPTGGER